MPLPEIAASFFENTVEIYPMLSAICGNSVEAP